MSIPTNAERTLFWWFENRWLPSNRQLAGDSRLKATRCTVDEFIAYAGCDPPLGEITQTHLTEFEHLGRRQFTKRVAANRRRRIEAIIADAIPSRAKPQATQAPYVEGTLRHFAKTIIPTLNPDAARQTLKEYVTIANRFTDWHESEIAIDGITMDLIDQFEESTTKMAGWRMRSLMRIYDPVKFRVRQDHSLRRKELNRGNGSEFLLANVYEKRYEPVALRSRRPNTKRLYRTTLLMFDKHLGRSATLDDFNDETVSAFAAWRLSKGLSKSSINKDLFNLLAIWRWCNRKGLVESWPDVSLEQPVKKAPEAWTEDDMKKLYLAATNAEGKLGKISASCWWCALLLVAWDSGERINAIVNLEWRNVDLKRKWLRFDAEYRKGGSEDSVVHLSGDTAAALKRIQVADGLVFPWPFCKTYLWRKFGALLRAAGLPDDARSKFHRIRRSVASHAEAAGGNATAMLRHSKREITEAYLDPTIVKQQQPNDFLFRLPPALD